MIVDGGQIDDKRWIKWLSTVVRVIVVGGSQNKLQLKK